MSQPVPNRENQPGGRGSSAGQNQAGERTAKSVGAYPVIGLPEVFLLEDMEALIVAKAVRRVYAYFQELGWESKVGQWDIITLSSVNAYCQAHGRVCAAGENVVNFSGYTRKWKARIYSGIRKGLEVGTLEHIKQNAGQSIALTIKGDRVLKVFTQMKAKVLQELTNTYWKVREAKERKALAKAMKAA